jgi:hypothetical protein
MISILAWAWRKFEQRRLAIMAEAEEESANATTAI